MNKRYVSSLALLLVSLGPAFAQQVFPAGSASSYGGVPSAGAPATGVAAPASCATGACAPTACNAGTVDGCFSPLEGICGPTGRVWASAEYLLWWTKSAPVPALVTSGPAAGRGVIGTNGTNVDFGDSGDHPTRSGGRFTVGGWVDCDHILGLEVSYFFLGSESKKFDAGGTGAAGTNAVGRPFFDVTSRSANAQLVALPGVVSGTVSARTSSELQGWAPNLLYNVCCDCDYRVDAFAGFRYFQLNESLRVSENLTTLSGSSIPAGTNFAVRDEFDTRNEFYGGAFGLKGEYHLGKFFVGGTTSLALGTTHEVVNVRGSSLITTPPSTMPTVNNGGLLALPSNSGRASRDEFAVVPEVGVRVGYHVTDNVRASVGYNLVYWSDVARPGDQIDLSVDPRQLPRSGQTNAFAGAVSPASRFHSSDFWAQGLSFSVEFRY